MFVSTNNVTKLYKYSNCYKENIIENKVKSDKSNLLNRKIQIKWSNNKVICDHKFENYITHISLSRFTYYLSFQSTYAPKWVIFFFFFLCLGIVCKEIFSILPKHYEYVMIQCLYTTFYTYVHKWC